MKDTFLLDIDDTLLDFQRLEREQLKSVLTSFGERADDAVAARFHAINDALWKALERGEVTRERLVVLRFERLKEEFSLRTRADALAVCFLDAMRRHVYPFQGALDFLRALARRGRLYAVTNGARRVQRAHMQAAGMLPLFSDVFVSEEVGFSKPSWEYVRHVEAHIPALKKEHTMYVGDSLTSDMVCAKRLGVDFVLYCPAGVPQGYDGYAAADYDQVLSLAERL